jgi:hypothetical protein
MRFEREGTVRASIAEAIQRTLETAGVIFIDALEKKPSTRLSQVPCLGVKVNSKSPRRVERAGDDAPLRER